MDAHTQKTKGTTSKTLQPEPEERSTANDRQRKGEPKGTVSDTGKEGSGYLRIPQTIPRVISPEVAQNIDQEIQRISSELDEPEHAIEDTKRLLEEIGEQMDLSFEQIEQNQRSVRRYIEERESEEEEYKNRADEIMKRVEEGMKKLENLNEKGKVPSASKKNNDKTFKTKEEKSTAKPDAREQGIQGIKLEDLDLSNDDAGSSEDDSEVQRSTRSVIGASCKDENPGPNRKEGREVSNMGTQTDTEEVTSSSQPFPNKRKMTSQGTQTDTKYQQNDDSIRAQYIFDTKNATRSTQTDAVERAQYPYVDEEDIKREKLHKCTQTEEQTPEKEHYVQEGKNKDEKLPNVAIDSDPDTEQAREKKEKIDQYKLPVETSSPRQIATTEGTVTKEKLMHELEDANKIINQLQNEREPLKEALENEVESIENSLSCILVGHDENSPLWAFETGRVIGPSFVRTFEADAGRVTPLTFAKGIQEHGQLDSDDFPVETTLLKYKAEARDLSNREIDAKVENDVNVLISIRNPDGKKVMEVLQNETEQTELDRGHAADKLVSVQAKLKMARGDLNEVSQKIRDFHGEKESLLQNIKETNQDILNKFSYGSFKEQEEELISALDDLNEKLLQHTKLIDGASSEGFVQSIPGDDTEGKYIGAEKDKELHAKKMSMIKRALSDVNIDEKLESTKIEREAEIPGFKDIEDTLVAKVDCLGRINDIDWQLHDMELEDTMRKLRDELAKTRPPKKQLRTVNTPDLEILKLDPEAQAELHDLNAQMKELNLKTDELNDLQAISDRLRHSLVESDRDIQRKIIASLRSRDEEDGTDHENQMQLLGKLTNAVEALSVAMDESGIEDHFPNSALMDSLQREKRMIQAESQKAMIKSMLKSSNEQEELLYDVIQVIKKEEERLHQLEFASELLGNTIIPALELQSDQNIDLLSMGDMEIESKLIWAFNQNLGFIENVVAEIERVSEAADDDNGQQEIRDALKKVQEDKKIHTNYLQEIQAYLAHGRIPESPENPIQGVLKMKKNLFTNLESINTNINHHMQQNGDPRLLDTFVRKKLQIQEKLDHADLRILDKKEVLEGIVDALSNQELRLQQETSEAKFLELVPQSPILQTLKATLEHCSAESDSKDTSAEERDLAAVSESALVEGHEEESEEIDLKTMLTCRRDLISHLQENEKSTLEDLKDLEFEIHDRIESFTLPNSKKNLWMEIDEEEVENLNQHLLELKEAKSFLEKHKSYTMKRRGNENMEIDQAVQKTSCSFHIKDLKLLSRFHIICAKKLQQLEYYGDLLTQQLSVSSRTAEPEGIPPEDQNNGEVGLSIVKEALLQMLFLGNGQSPGQVLLDYPKMIKAIFIDQNSQLKETSPAITTGGGKLEKSVTGPCFRLLLAEREEQLRKLYESKTIAEDMTGDDANESSTDKETVMRLQLLEDMLFDFSKLSYTTDEFILSDSLEYFSPRTTSDKNELAVLLEERDCLYRELYSTSKHPNTGTGDIVAALHTPEEEELRGAILEIDERIIQIKDGYLQRASSSSISSGLLLDLVSLVIASAKTMDEELSFNKLYINSEFSSITEGSKSDKHYSGLDENTEARLKLITYKLNQEEAKREIESLMQDQYAEAASVLSSTPRRRLSAIEERNELAEMVREVDDRVELIKRRNDLEDRIRSGLKSEKEVSWTNEAQDISLQADNAKESDKSSSSSSPRDSLTEETTKSQLHDKLVEEKSKLTVVNNRLLTFLKTLQDNLSSNQSLERGMKLDSGLREVLQAEAETIGSQIQQIETEKKAIEKKLSMLQKTGIEELASIDIRMLLDKRRETLKLLKLTENQNILQTLIEEHKKAQAMLQGLKSAEDDLNAEWSYYNKKLQKLAHEKEQCEALNYALKQEEKSESEPDFESMLSDITQALGENLLKICLDARDTEALSKYLENSELQHLHTVVRGLQNNKNLEQALQRSAGKEDEMAEEIEDLKNEIARNESTNKKLTKQLEDLGEEFQTLTEKVLDDERDIDVVRSKLGLKLFKDLEQFDTKAKDDFSSDLDALRSMAEESVTLEEVVKYYEIEIKKWNEDRMALMKAYEEKEKLELGNKELEKIIGEINEEQKRVKEELEREKSLRNKSPESHLSSPYECERTTGDNKIKKHFTSFIEKETQSEISWDLEEELRERSRELHEAGQQIEELVEKLETRDDLLFSLKEENNRLKTERIASMKETKDAETETTEEMPEVQKAEIKEQREYEVNAGASEGEVELPGELQGHDTDERQTKDAELMKCIEALSGEAASLMQSKNSYVEEKNKLAERLEAMQEDISKLEKQMEEIGSVLREELEKTDPTALQERGNGYDLATSSVEGTPVEGIRTLARKYKDRINDMNSKYKGMELSNSEKVTEEKKHLEKQVNDLLKSQDELRGKIGKLTDEVETLEKARVAENQNKKELENELENAIKECKSTEDKFAHVMNETTALQQENLKLKLECERDKQEFEKKQNDVSHIREERDQLVKTLEGKELQIQVLLEEREDLQLKLGDKEEKLQETEMQLNSLSESHKDLTDRGAEMLQIFEMLDEENKGKSLVIEELKENLHGVNKDLLHMKQNVAESEKALEKQRMKEENFRLTITEREEEVENLKKNLSDLQHALDSKAAENHKLKENEKRFQDSMKSLEKKFEEMEEIAQLKDTNLQQVEQDLGNIKENHLALSSEKEDLEQSLIDLQQRHEKEVKEFQKKFDELEQALDIKVQDLISREKGYKQRLHDQEKIYSDTNKEMAALIEKMKADHQNKLTDISKKVQEREEDMQELKKEYNKQIREMKVEFEEKIREKDKSLKEIIRRKEEQLDAELQAKERAAEDLVRNLKRDYEMEREKIEATYKEELEEKIRAIKKYKEDFEDSLNLSREEFNDDLQRHLAKIENLETEYDALSKSIAEERKQRDVMENQKKKMESDLNELTKINERLERERAMLQYQLSEYEESVKNQSQLNKDLDKAMKTLHDEVTTGEKKRDKLVKENEAVRRQVTFLESEVLEKTSLLKNQKQKLREVKAQCDSRFLDSERKLKGAQDSLAEKDSIIKVMSRNEAELNNKIATQRLTFEQEKRELSSSTNDEISTLRRLVKQLEMKLEDKDDEKEFMKKTADNIKNEYESKIAILTERKEQQRQHIKNSQSKISDLENTIETKASELSLRIKETERLRNSHKEEKRLSELKDDKIRQLKKKLNEQQADFEQKSAKLEHSLLEQRASVMSLHSDLDSSRTENKELKDAIKDLKSQINEQKSYEEHESIMEKRKAELEELRKTVYEQKRHLEDEMKRYYEKTQQAIKEEQENKYMQQLERKKALMNKEREKMIQSIREGEQKLEETRNELRRVRESVQRRELELKQEEKILVENLENEFKRKMEEIIRENYKERQKISKTMQDDRDKFEKELSITKTLMKEECEKKLSEQKQDLEREFQDALFELLKESKESIEELQNTIASLENENKRVKEEQEEEIQTLEKKHEKERGALEQVVKELLRSLIKYRDDKVKLVGKHKDEIGKLEEEVEIEKCRLEVKSQQDLIEAREKLQSQYAKSLENERSVMEHKVESMRHDWLRDLKRSKHGDVTAFKDGRRRENDDKNFQVISWKPSIAKREEKRSEGLYRETGDLRRKIMDISEQLVTLQKRKEI